MSSEASAKGISARCTEMTSVILKSVPHETQNQPETSLLLTPRLPTDGEPSRCKQEVAESVVTAERANGTVEMVEPAKMVVDINRTALLGRKPAETACEVNEGDGMECKDLQLPKAELYCEERHQHSGNTMGDVPSAQKLLQFRHIYVFTDNIFVLRVTLADAMRSMDVLTPRVPSSLTCMFPPLLTCYWFVYLYFPFSVSRVSRTIPFWTDDSFMLTVLSYAYPFLLVDLSASCYSWTMTRL